MRCDTVETCLPRIIAVLIAIPVAWFIYLAFFDRTPPLELYDGRLIPSIVYPGETDVKVTWHARFSGRDCPGETQRELIDSQNNLWPKLKRSRGGIFHPSASDPLSGMVTTPPLDIPSQIDLGQAAYRVTQFYYCNVVQRLFDWPIVQRSVPIPFNVRARPIK